MTIKVDTIAPGLGLGMRNFSQQMADLSGCLGWFTFEDASIRLGEDKRVQAVRPRVGMHDLIRPEFSAGPVMDRSGAGFPVAQFEKATHDYLTCATSLDDSCFSLAAVIEVRQPAVLPQNIMAISHNRQHLRALRDKVGFGVKGGKIDTLDCPHVQNGKALLLIVMSGSDGLLSLRVRDLAKTEPAVSIPYAPSLPKGCVAVLGAECVGTEPDTPMPSAPRSWDGGVLDFWVFERDILAGGNELALMDSYFTEVYGAAT